MADQDFKFTLNGFNEGLSPVAHIDTATFIGNKGQASEMLADIISKPGYITQSPALADLTNGNQSGAVTELIRQILDNPVTSNTTYGIGTSKLFKISPTAVTSGGSPSWPQTVTGMTEGESAIKLGDTLFGLYNTASAGDILSMPLDGSDIIDHDWGSTTDQALEKAPHPAAVKEDIMLFGNGRYVGVLILGSPATLDVQKLDFGEGNEVVDIVFNANVWWIAVNSGEGKRGQIYVYDGSALSNQLSDEAGVGDQQIGFLYVQNGNIFVAYEDTSADGYTIGFLTGRQIKPLRYFTGSLPNHRQKALYKNTILFAAGENIMSMGATVDQLPLQISALADGGYSAIGAVACPFGIPMIASTQSTSYRLAQFSGYSTSSTWKSRYINTCEGRKLGKIQNVIIHTKPLEENAKCTIQLEANQGQLTSNSLVVETTNKTRHVFTSIGFIDGLSNGVSVVEDVRVVVTYSNGNATNDCPIREIVVEGNYAEY